MVSMTKLTRTGVGSRVSFSPTARARTSMWCRSWIQKIGSRTCSCDCVSKMDREGRLEHVARLFEELDVGDVYVGKRIGEIAEHRHQFAAAVHVEGDAERHVRAGGQDPHVLLLDEHVEVHRELRQAEVQER